MISSLVAALLVAVLPVSAAPRTTPDPSPGESAAVAPEKTPPPLPAWFSRVNAGPAGAFPPPRSYQASYRVTWADVEAAHIDAKCAAPEGGLEIQTVIKAATTGGARLLYKLDATATCVAERRTLHPVRFEQTQEMSSKRLYARVEFTPQEAVRSNRDPSRKASGEEGEEPAKLRPRHFRYPGMFDMHSALLYLRSLPLTNGEEKTFIVMAANTPYLVTVKVLSHERVKVKAGDYPAVQCSLSLEKISKRGELEAHKSFKSARAWISDDANRILLKIETQVFVGSVGLELEKATF